MTQRRHVVALGGGHGLSATLRALRIAGHEPVAVVGTGDDGGSSGRLRAHLGVPPPGDLRMALAALSDEGLWLRVIQHRFGGSGDVEGHALGNLILVALWEETGDIVAGLDRLGGVLGVKGRVLPNCLEAVEVIADVDSPDGETREVRGQAALTTGRGRVSALRIDPHDPAGCPAAVDAISDASHVVIGPGSWFTSILPHLLVPDIARALRQTSARKTLVLNASEQAGETEGFTAARYLESWAEIAPDIELDLVIADPSAVDDPRQLEEAAARVGARVALVEVLAGSGQHDPVLLAAALEPGLGAPGPTG